MTMLTTTMEDLLQLPVMCLSTATQLPLEKLIEGKNVVIDVWTTRCTKCPAALDALQERAMRQPTNSGDNNKIQFVSICCDRLDGARAILEPPLGSSFSSEQPPKWPHIQHYFMEPAHKDQMKHMFGFTQVPFYMTFDSQGNLTQHGNKIDWDKLLLVGKYSPPPDEDDKENTVLISSCSKMSIEPVDEQEFVLDDMDF